MKFTQLTKKLPGMLIYELRSQMDYNLIKSKIFFVVSAMFKCKAARQQPKLYCS